MRHEAIQSWLEANGPQDGPWTLQELLEIPEDGIRYELVDGALVVNPPPSRGHQDASFALHTLLRAGIRAAGLPLRVWQRVGIQLSDSRLLIPDLVVAHASASGELLDPADVVLVVKVVSPGSTVLDWRAQPALYAGVGIRHFWRIELGRGPAVSAYRLGRSGEYELAAEVSAGAQLRLSEPVDLAFDPADLVED